MRYGAGPEILRDVNFTLPPRSFHFLTGPSGAGKSSLLKLLYLDHLPSHGTIEVFGRNIAETPRSELPAIRRRIGVVFQDFRLIDHLTALENVAVPLELAGVEDAQDRARDELIAVGLRERLAHYPAELSGGEQQRVAIARALAPNPAIVVADEPTGNLDEETGRQIIDVLFAGHAKHGTTLVLVTHDVALAARCARVARLRSGRIDSIGKP